MLAHQFVAALVLLVHGKVITMDPKDSIAEAIAIRDGKIVAVGSNRTILALGDMFSGKPEVVDLHGRTATPGLIDSHAHIAEGGLAELNDVNLRDASSIADIVQRIKARVAQSKAGEWIQGSGWDEGKLAEQRYVVAADLDSVSPNNPVWLVHTTGHYGTANSAALRMAKIDASSPNPAAGTIDRNANDTPSGVLKESAKSAVTSLIPSRTLEQRRRGILRSIETMHREGMTAVKDPAIDLHTWEAYRSVLDSGQLSVHVCALWAAGATVASARSALSNIEAQPKPPLSLGDGRLLSCGAKVFMDGSGGARTAWLYDEWDKNSTEIDAGNRGYPTTDPEVYRQQVKLFELAGVHVGTHAIGDRAIDWVVDTYAQVLKDEPVRSLRYSIIHANIPTDHAIGLMAQLQREFDAGYPEAQPPFMWWIGDTYAANFGPQRARRLLPLRTFGEHGIKWAGGSDYPVTPLPARYGLWAATTRETLRGTYGPHPFGETEAVNIHAALRAYTADAARQLFLETHIGSIEPGKDADIAVWKQDPYSVEPSELKNLTCALTLFKGQVVYRASDSNDTSH